MTTVRLQDKQWAKIRDFLKQDPNVYVGNETQCRRFVEAVIRVIGKIKHFRRIFSRFDKLAQRYLGFLQLASTLIWLR